MIFILNQDEVDLLKEIEFDLASLRFDAADNSVVLIGSITRDFIADLFDLLLPNLNLDDDERRILSNLGWRVVHNAL